MPRFQAGETFERMLLVRRLEERLLELADAGELDGTVLHSGIGQEAGVVACGLLRLPGDVMFATHRSVHQCAGWGMDLVTLVAETIGRRAGNANGLQGHMHLADLEQGVLGANGIVGAAVPLGAGAALGLQQLGTGGVAVAFVGDGGVNTGAFHEGLNLASVWRLPLVIVVENNGFAEMTPSAPLTGGTAAARAVAFGIPGEIVDGADAEPVYRAIEAAFARARAGEGPSLVECLVHRAGGHWVGDPEHYRDPEERESFPVRDPILRLLRSGEIGRDTERDARARVERTLERVVARALASPPPGPGDVLAAGSPR